MTTHAHHRKVLSVSLAMAVVLTACGGDEATSTTAPSSSTGGTTSTTTAATTIPVDGSGDAEPTAPTATEAATVTSDLPPVTTVPEPPTTDPVPTTAVVDDPIIDLMLAIDDFGPGWQTEGYLPFDPSGDESVDVCPAYASINVLDVTLEYQIEFASPTFDFVNTAIGRADDAAAATAVVEQFGEVVDCDNTELFGDGSTVGGVMDVEGADSASVFRFEPADEAGSHYELATLAVGDVLVVLGFFWSDNDTTDYSTFLDELAVKAAAAVREG